MLTSVKPSIRNLLSLPSPSSLFISFCVGGGGGGGDLMTLDGADRVVYFYLNGSLYKVGGALAK